MSRMMFMARVVADEVRQSAVRAVVKAPTVQV